VKIATFALFFIFLIGFMEFAPYAQNGSREFGNSLFAKIFWLYFFIIEQTLGIVHEAGHGVCYILPCPKFVMVINATIFQWLFPAGIGFYYYKKGNFLAALMGLFFLGVSMQYTAWYVSTSHEGAIVPAAKSFLGVDAYHDFHYILSVFGVLAYDWLIATILKIIAYLLMFGTVFTMLLSIFQEKEH
jgi:hypothetical protein